MNKIESSVLPERAVYGYIPGLDGLRAVSVMIVIAAHFGLEHIIPGGFGVTVFFFISGFLITRLILAEQSAFGRIGLSQFYIRRLLRLFPALIFMVCASTLYFSVMGYGTPSRTEFLGALFYFTNIYQVTEAALNGAGPFMSWTHLWSLAVEEHFYSIFPLIVLACGLCLRRLMWSVIIISMAVPAWRLVVALFLNVPVESYNYMMTDARIDSIAWGCLFSLLLNQAGRAEAFHRLIGTVPFCAALGLLLLTFLVREELFRHVWRFSVQGGALFVLFLNFYYLRGLRFAVHLMELRPIKWLGTVSYGLYLWHFPVLDACQRMFGEGSMAILSALVFSLLITVFSFYVVERPFNELRKLKKPAGCAERTVLRQ